MNYKVLYRKYRPQVFEDVVGQDYIIKILQNSISSNKLSHAYIFSGPRGTGKTSTAKIFAKAINCLNPKDGSPCGECEFCKNFVDNPDIIEMDAASNNGVDEIREIIDNIKLTPSNAKYKVYIIDEVHMLTTNAFNALLLTLEEPPKHVIFILATTNIEAVPITILSRCQRFDFKKITTDCIANYLIDVCKKEKIKYDKDAINEISEVSDGGMRDALSLLDQLSKNVEKITLDLVEKEINIVSTNEIKEIINNIEKNSSIELINIINSFDERSINFKYLLKKLINLLGSFVIEKKTYNKATRLPYDKYAKLIFELNDLICNVNINVNPYDLLKVMLLSYIDNDSEVKLTPLNDKKEEIKINRLASTKKSEKLKEDIINIRVNNCFYGAKKNLLEDFLSLHKDIVSSSIKKGRVKSLLEDSTPVAASDEYVIYETINEKAANSGNDILNQVEETIKEKINKNYKVIFISKERWSQEKNNYINNIKNNIKYKYIAEENNENFNIVDVFSNDKIEII